MDEGLKKKKWYHRSIVIGDDVYHVGGDNDYGGEPKWIEKWKKSKTNFEKETKELIDEDGLSSGGKFPDGDLYTPEIFVVGDDFCNKN